MKYIKQLDALRALAILSVVAAHWLKEESMLYKIAVFIDAPNIFFTLSGFLITKILLNDRIKAEKAGYNKFILFKNFFIKRMLRILPTYFLLLYVVFMINSSEKVDYAYYLTFTANFHIYSEKSWGQITHLWTMAVEEQFYLIWPFIILLINKKYLPLTFLAFILIAVISQHLLPHNDFSNLLTFTCFDTLALGALLAWVAEYKPNSLNKTYKFLCIAAALGLTLIIINLITDTYFFLSKRTLTATIVLWMLAYFMVKSNQGPKLSFIFNNKALIMLGKMSYGIYLYHHVLPYYSWKLLFPINERLPFLSRISYNQYLLFVENFCLLIGITWLSWRFIETPIAGLKKHFKSPNPKASPVMVLQTLPMKL